MNINMRYVLFIFLAVIFSEFCLYSMDTASHYDYSASSLRVCFDCTNALSLQQALNEASQNPHIVLDGKCFHDHYMETHEKNKNLVSKLRYRCQHCPNGSSVRLGQYQLHTLRHHRHVIEDDLLHKVAKTKICPLCGAKYKNIQSLKMHILMIPHVHVKDVTKKLVAPLQVLHDVEQKKTIKNKASLLNLVSEKNVENCCSIDDHTAQVLWGAFYKK